MYIVRMRLYLLNHGKYKAKVQATTVVDVGVTPVLLSSLNVLPTALRCCCCCCDFSSCSFVPVEREK